MKDSGNWNAADFIKTLVESNRLSKSLGFRFARVSGLQGFVDAVDKASEAPNIIAVDDSTEGYTELCNTSRNRSVKSVYISMRHAPGDMEARARCLEIIREIYRQFLTAIIPERVRLQQNSIYLDSRIPFNEMDRYFSTGAACAWFQLTVDIFADLRYRRDEWE